MNQMRVATLSLPASATTTKKHQSIITDQTSHALNWFFNKNPLYVNGRSSKRQPDPSGGNAALSIIRLKGCYFERILPSRVAVQELQIFKCLSSSSRRSVVIDLTITR
jgi:hypothetical protein